MTSGDISVPQVYVINKARVTGPVGKKQTVCFTTDKNEWMREIEL